jgi:HD-like signal output (HDOD) protein
MPTDTAFDVIFLKMDRLPTLPGIAMRILEAVQKEDPDLQEIGKIISTDPPLSVEVLKIVNSAFYGLPSKVTTVFHAMNLLGINTVKNLALSFTLVKNFQTNSSVSFDYTLFWKDSLIGAVAARLLAEKILPISRAAPQHRHSGIIAVHAQTIQPGVKRDASLRL